jgi:hypothetical protein
MSPVEASAHVADPPAVEDAAAEDVTIAAEGEEGESGEEE